MNNYDAWKLNPQHFCKENTIEGKLEFLVRFGILAPSSHNSQPWKFKIIENSISICADLMRRLPISDPSGRMLYTALGCATENIRIAASYYGLKTAIAYNNALERSTPEHTLIMTFSEILPKEGRTGQLILEAIIQRSSYRGKYLNLKIPESVFGELSALNDKTGIHVNFFMDAQEKESLALIAGEGMKRKMSDREFRKELAGWVRSNVTFKRDGMPGSGHGLSFVKALFAPFVLRRKDVSEFERKKIEKRVMNFPIAGVISSKNDNALSWVQCGEILGRILIHAYARDLSASIVAAPIEDKGAREELKTIASEKSGQEIYPQVFFGFGYPEKKFPNSPRRKLTEVLL